MAREPQELDLSGFAAAVAEEAPGRTVNAGAGADQVKPQPSLDLSGFARELARQPQKLDLSGFAAAVAEESPARGVDASGLADTVEPKPSLDLSGFKEAVTPPEVPIETHPFVRNTLSDPVLTDEQRRTLVETYGRNYLEAYGKDPTMAESFVLNFRDAWGNYNTLGAELRRKSVGGDPLIGYGANQEIEDSIRVENLITAELKRREAGGKEENIPVWEAIGGMLTIRHPWHKGWRDEKYYRAAKEEELQGLLVAHRTERAELQAELNEKRFAGLLDEAGKQARFAALNSTGVKDNAAAFAGQLAGAAVDPINFIGGSVKQVASLPMRMTVKAGEVGTINALANPLLQKGAESANAQEGFEWKRFFADAGLGSLVGGSFPLLGEIGRVIARRFGVQPEDLAKMDTQQALKEIGRKADLPDTEIARALTDEAAEQAEQIKQLRDKTSVSAADEAAEVKVLQEAEGNRQRGFSRRMEGDERMDVNEVRANPEEYYTPQSNETGRQIVTQMPDSQLEDVFRKAEATTGSGENYSVLAGLELMNRRLTRGEPIRSIREELSKRGTSVAQMLQQFGEIKTTTPAGMVSMVDDLAAQFNRKIPDQALQRGRELADARLQAMERLKEAEVSLQQNFTDKTAAQIAGLKKEAAATARAFDEWAMDYTPQRMFKTLADTMKLNLLTSSSLMINVIGNMTLQPVWISKNIIGSGLDFLVSLRTGKRTRKLNPKDYGEGLKGAFDGLKQGAEVLLKGGSPDDYIKAELHRGFRPMRAMIQALSPSSRGIMPVMENGQVALSDRAKKLLEGLFGVPPEAVARMLQFGDKPFRYGAERAGRSQETALRGLRGVDRERFIQHPDPVSRDLIAEKAKAAVFMQDNAFSRKFAEWMRDLEKIPKVGGALRYVTSAVVPFVQFPTNFIVEAVRYRVPGISFGMAVYRAGQGQQDKAIDHLAAGLAGMTMFGAAGYLWQNGVVTPHIDYRDKKLKALSYSFAQPPGSMNLSGLRRLLVGEDGSFQDGDITVAYEKLGIWGMILQGETEMQWRQEKDKAEGKIVPPLEWWNRAIPSSEDMPNTLSYIAEATPLLNMAGFLGAIQSGRADRWARNFFQAVGSTVVPNTLTAALKTQYEYIPELTGETIGETFKNVWNYKLHRLDKDHPVKVGLLGERVLRTPEGENPWQWHLLNPVDLQSKESEPIYRFIETLYKRTADTRVIPGIPSEVFTHPKTKERLVMKKGSKNHELLMRHVGLERRKLLERASRSDALRRASNETVVSLMQRIYSQGLGVGLVKFVRDPAVNWKEIEESPEPIGFDLEGIDLSGFAAAVAEETAER
ncbi:MAG: hypothetical protein AAGJ81_10795 [Verrucomicrobiota bacterium]